MRQFLLFRTDTHLVLTGEHKVVKAPTPGKALSNFKYSNRGNRFNGDVVVDKDGYWWHCKEYKPNE